MEPLDRQTFDAGELLRKYPPLWMHKNKQAIFDRVCQSKVPFAGPIRYARWPAVELPSTVTRRSRFQAFSGVFCYNQSSPDCVDWHLNFADEELFVAYSGSLLAQDELQVLEHPSLGSLKRALQSQDRAHKTISEKYTPTPVTIAGVQRRCAFDTLPNPTSCTKGLYGNAFANATVEQVLAATRLLSPPTTSNILAICARPGMSDIYTREQISFLLQTAYTGFMAARQESHIIAPDGARVVIHTGFWGCGAYGGNRMLMTILQILAADLAGVDLAFYGFDLVGEKIATEALRQYEAMSDHSQSMPVFLDGMAAYGFLWGESDGN